MHQQLNLHHDLHSRTLLISDPTMKFPLVDDLLRFTFFFSMIEPFEIDVNYKWSCTSFRTDFSFQKSEGHKKSITSYIDWFFVIQRVGVLRYFIIRFFPKKNLSLIWSRRRPKLKLRTLSSIILWRAFSSCCYCLASSHLAKRPIVWLWMCC